MKIVDMNGWEQAARDALHRRYQESVGVGIGPHAREVLDAMIAEGVLDMPAPPGFTAVAYRYDDDAGSSLRVIFEPKRKR